MTENQNDFNSVFGAILCGRCVCGERLWFSDGQIYKRLPDCELDTLITDTNSWLIENKTRINEAFDEYKKLRDNYEYHRVDVFRFVNEWDPNDQIHLGNLSSLVEEFRERVPILVRVRDSHETCHLICMLNHLRPTE